MRANPITTGSGAEYPWQKVQFYDYTEYPGGRKVIELRHGNIPRELRHEDEYPSARQRNPQLFSSFDRWESALFDIEDRVRSMGTNVEVNISADTRR